MYRASGRTLSSFEFEDNDNLLSVKVRQTYQGEDGVHDAFWRSIITDRIGATTLEGATKPAPKKYGAAFDAWRGAEDLIDLDKETGIEMSASARTNPSSLSSRLGITKDVLDLIPEFSAFVDMVIKGRKFAITRRGYMGLVPQVAHEGDLTRILLECTVPVVLHDVGDYQPFCR
jgi:hypothetical protein